MIYGAISEKDERYYTYLKKVFEAIGNVQQDYNWLITDCECCPRNIETEKLLNAEYCWITGEQLTEIVLEEDFQWIWAVLSAAIIPSRRGTEAVTKAFPALYPLL